MLKQAGITSFLLPIFVAATYIFLYAPIIVLIVFSFNANPLSYQWTTATMQWYNALIHSQEAWNALYNSLIIASLSVCLSVLMGSLFVFFCKRSYLSRLVFLFYLNLAIPEIVLAVGLATFFYFFKVPLGITTLVAGHTILGLGYVIPIVYARYKEFDQRLVEASLDLGATSLQTFFKIVLPLSMPALLGAGMLVFIISFDDFVLSFFCAGATTQTLPLYIFSLIRSGSSPLVSALSTILLMISSLLVILFSSLQIKKMGMLR